MSDDLRSHVSDLVHEPTQTEGRGVDLTVAGIGRVTAPGRVDFGGGELSAAETEPVATTRRDPDDDYGWWHLDAGTYLVSHNESLEPPADGALRVQVRDALRERGAAHPTLAVRELGLVPLTVGGAGLRLKENARVSTVVEVVPG